MDDLRYQGQAVYFLTKPQLSAYREPPEACPGSASGRKMDGSDVPDFNVLPVNKVTIEMIDVGKVTNQRATDTRVEEYGGWRYPPTQQARCL